MKLDKLIAINMTKQDLIKWNREKKQEGFIPTVDMLIEEMEDDVADCHASPDDGCKHCELIGNVI